MKLFNLTVVVIVVVVTIVIIIRAVTLAGEDDRKVLRDAIKNAPAATIKHRIIPPEVIEQFKRRVDGLKSQVDEILEEEKEDRLVSK
jgi:ATP-dependent RNA helicase DDX27